MIFKLIPKLKKIEWVHFIAKTKLKILHFFNFSEGLYYIGDLFVDIELSSEIYNEIFFTEKSEKFIDETKRQIIQKFSEDVLLEKRCKDSNQVWAFYIEKGDKIKKGAIVKKLYYDDNVLFYPGGDDVKKYERHIRLKEIGI